MRTSETINEVAKALSKFQADCPAPKKNAVNPHFKSKYSTLDEIINTVRTPLAENGLSFFQSLLTENDLIGCKTLILHSSGEFLESDVLWLPMGKATAQGAGSAATYAKRYSLSATLGIAADEDDDGNQATDNSGSKPASTSPAIVSPAQIKAIGAKVSNIAKQTEQDAKAVYQSAAKHLGINKSTSELTKAEASKVIDYLTTLEG